MKTYTAKASDIQKKWYVVDAENLVLGRVATQIALVLRGKNKPMFTPSMDCGDNVIVINAEKIHLTGKKLTDKVYYRHTGHPGGIKETTPRKILSGKFPERVIEMAVTRMLTRESPMARRQLRHLFIYAGTEHPHQAQNPEKLDLAAKNPKNNKVRKA